MESMTRAFAQLPIDRAAAVRYILFDIDDTVTVRGKLTAEAYSAMWKLKDAGYSLCPVTGRPAGWCDLIIREWPIEGVICENGAYADFYEGNRIRRMLNPKAASDPREALIALAEKVLREIGGARLARDQFSRIYDVAFDISEDEPHLTAETAREILALCEREGAKAKLSSIHVNAWFGEYDKLSMARLYLARRNTSGMDNDEYARATALFIGDSPNDEPMFSFFPVSVGVENAMDYMADFKTPPAYIVRGMGGAGFARMAEMLLDMVGGIA